MRTLFGVVRAPCHSAITYSLAASNLPSPLSQPSYPTAVCPSDQQSHSPSPLFPVGPHFFSLLIIRKKSGQKVLFEHKANLKEVISIL